MCPESGFDSALFTRRARGGEVTASDAAASSQRCALCDVGANARYREAARVDSDKCAQLNGGAAQLNGGAAQLALRGFHFRGTLPVYRGRMAARSDSVLLGLHYHASPTT